MGIMSIVKSVIEHFRKAGKTEKEISNMIEQAADKATVNKGIAQNFFISPCLSKVVLNQ